MAPTAEFTAEQIFRLTLWKWVYHLGSEGFSRQEAERLLFEKWRQRGAAR